MSKFSLNYLLKKANQIVPDQPATLEVLYCLYMGKKLSYFVLACKELIPLSQV